MKRVILKILSSAMALLVLFVTMGWDVNFHYCSENHHLMSSFGDASQLCEHCQHHHHHSRMNAEELEEHQHVLHFGTKCCCEDFNSKIQFTDDYTFSVEKHLVILLNSVVVPFIEPTLIDQIDQHKTLLFSPKEIPLFPSGHFISVFFSNLKLNPLNL